MRSLITQMNYDASFQLESMHMLRVTAELRKQLGRALAHSHPQLLYVVLSFSSFVTRTCTPTQTHKHTRTQAHKHTRTQAHAEKHTSAHAHKNTCIASYNMRMREQKTHVRLPALAHQLIERLPKRDIIAVALWTPALRVVSPLSRTNKHTYPHKEIIRKWKLKTNKDKHKRAILRKHKHISQRSCTKCIPTRTKNTHNGAKYVTFTVCELMLVQQCE